MRLSEGFWSMVGRDMQITLPQSSHRRQPLSIFFQPCIEHLIGEISDGITDLPVA